MGIALTLKQYLDGQHAPYDVMVHELTATARACEVRAACLAKGVLLRDGRGYLLAVLPASRQLDAAALARLTDRPAALATEEEAGGGVPDRAPGAPPPVGPAPGVASVRGGRGAGGAGGSLAGGGPQRPGG